MAHLLGPLSPAAHATSLSSPLPRSRPPTAPVVLQLQPLINRRAIVVGLGSALWSWNTANGKEAAMAAARRQPPSSSLQEAKNALEEYKTTTYVAKAKQPATESVKKLPIIGRLPIKKILTINNVQSKQERAKSTKLTNNIFHQEYNFLLKYKDEDKVTSIYPIGGSHQDPKAVALPEADPLKVYMMFQLGLLSAIYFKGNDLFHFFPDKIKRTIQIYNQRILQGRTGFLKIYATYPVFGEGEEIEEVKQQAIQLCQLGVSNNNYPDIEAVEFEDELTHFLNNYVLILLKGIKIRRRINYASKAIVIWSLQAKQPTEEDKRLLDKFLQEVITVNYDFTKDVKKEVCIKLHEEFPEDHVCTTCQAPSDESKPIRHKSNNVNRQGLVV